MTYRGIVSGNVVVFPPGIHLPDGLEVSVQPIIEKTRSAGVRSDTASLRNGVPVYQVQDPSPPAPGLEVVNALRDETP